MGCDHPIRIAPSLLAADFGRLADEVRRCEEAGADWLHLDVMDGHFVPNLTIGPPVVECVRKLTKLPLDCHLMVMEPEKYVNPFADAGADSITFHAEAVAEEYARRRVAAGWRMELVCQRFYNPDRLDETIGRIRERSRRVGVAVNPETMAESVDFLERVDLVLAMTVWPGFGGQRFMESTMGKIEKLRRMAPAAEIEVDGGLNPETARIAARAGANVIVAGSSTFRSPDMRAAVRALREGASSARSGGG